MTPPPNDADRVAALLERAESNARGADAWRAMDEAAATIRRLQGEVEALRGAVVQAAVPLEALNISIALGDVDLCDTAIGEIHNAVQHIRAALAGTGASTDGK